MGRGLKWISGIYILCIFLGGCKSSDTNLFLLGNDLVGNPNTNLVEIDTCTVYFSTIKQDSIATSNYSKLLVGFYTDGNLGNIKCNTVFSLGLPTVRTIESTDLFDSMRLTLRYSGDYYGDTTKPQTIRVYKLSGEITFPDGKYMYNTSRTPYNSDSASLLGTKTSWYPQPRSGQTVSIKINDNFGKYLFNEFRDHPENFTTNDIFLLQYLYGLYLAVDTTQSHVVIGYKAFDSTLMFRLYFHRQGLTTSNLEYDFPLTNSSKQYNQISGYYSDLPLSLLKTQRDRLQSSKSNGESYMQAGVGLMTRIDFPYMGTFLEFPRKGKILSAQLIIKAELGSDETIPLPDSLILFTTDKINRVNGYLADRNLNYIFGIKHKDDIHSDLPIYYTFDITSYLFSELAGNFYNTDHGLLVGLTTTRYTSTLSRLILTGQGNENEVPKLNIKYVFYE